MKYTRFSAFWFLLSISTVVLLSACGGGGGGATNVSVDTNVSASKPSASVLSMGLDLKQFKLSWTQADDATYYQLLENPDGSSGYTQLGSNLTTTSYDHIVPLYDRLNASYIVAACNSDGCTNSLPLYVTGTLEGAVGYIKASNSEQWDMFGISVALSDDGKTLAAGAYGEDSASPGVNGDQSDNSTPSAGAIYVFVNVDGVWMQQAYLKKEFDAGIGGFSISHPMALSGDGNTLVAKVSGAVYVFVREGVVWSQQQKIAIPIGTGIGDISLSDDGNTLITGDLSNSYTYVRNSGAWVQQAILATGMNKTALNGYGDFLAVGIASQVIFFSRNNNTWSQGDILTLPNGVVSPSSLALSDNGETIAIGLSFDASSAVGINGNENDTSAWASGSVYVYVKSTGSWSKQAYIKASNAESLDRFGFSVNLSDDGNMLVVGAYGEDGSAKGLNGVKDNAAGPTNSDGGSSGAAYVFIRKNNEWSEQAYLKASNTEIGDEYGRSVAINGDGQIIAVGDDRESSGAIGIDGDQTDNSTHAAGAVYLY